MVNKEKKPYEMRVPNPYFPRYLSATSNQNGLPIVSGNINDQGILQINWVKEFELICE